MRDRYHKAPPSALRGTLYVALIDSDGTKPPVSQTSVNTLGGSST